jgi:raffinose/stachyose/melibiose transport system substrate-binding protein
MKLTKRIIAVVGLLFFCIAGIANLSAAGQEEKTVTISQAASQNWVKEIDRQIAADFEKENPKIKIDFLVNPDDQYPSIIQTKINTGEVPDIIWWGSGLQLTNLPLDKLLDLSKEPWAPRLKGWARDGATIGGKLYGLNLWSVDGWVFVYNTEIFDKYNLKPPADYNELLKVCATLLANGVIPIYENVIDLWHSPVLLDQVGAELCARDKEFYNKLNSNKTKLADYPEFELFFTQFKELADKGYFGKTYMADAWTGSSEALGTKKYAMIAGWTTYQKEIERDYPQAGAENWKLFLSPLGVQGSPTVFDAGAGGAVRVVNKNSKNLAQVRKYFEYVTRPEVLKKFYAARPDFAVPSFPEVPQATGKGLESIKDVMENHSSLAYNSGALFYNQVGIGKEMQAMLAGQISPKQVVANLDAERIKSGKAAGVAGF